MTMSLIDNPKLQAMREELYGDAYHNQALSLEKLQDAVKKYDHLIRQAKSRISYKNFQAQQAVLADISKLTGHGNYLVALNVARRTLGQKAQRRIFFT